MSGKIIFDNGKHQCIMFSDLVKGDGIQSNQFLILHSDEETVGAVIDPGGDLTYTPLTLALLKHTDIKHIRYVIGSHQDPDIIASLRHCRVGYCIPKPILSSQGCGSVFYRILTPRLPLTVCKKGILSA